MVNNLQQATQRIQQARTQLQTRLQESKQARESLERAKQKLPERVSQRALRTGGIRERLRRGQIAKVEQKIEAQKGQVREFEKGLTEFERTQLKPAEAEIRRVQEFNRAVKLVQQAQDKGSFALGALAFQGEGLASELARDVVKRRNLATQDLTKAVREFERANPTEKLIVDWKNLSIKGVESGSFGQSLSVKQFNIKVGQLPGQLQTLDPSQQLTKIPELSRSEKISQVIEESPVLRRISKPSIVVEDIRRISPTTGNILFGDPELKVTSFVVPIPFTPTQRFIGFPKTQVLGTIEREGELAKIKLLTRTDRLNLFGEPIPTIKPTFAISGGVVVPKEISPGVQRGFIFGAEKGKPVDIKPFFGASVGERLGEARIVKEIDFLKVKAPIGRGSLVRSRTLTEEGIKKETTAIILKRGNTGEEIFFKIIGGKPSVRISKKGVEGLIIRDPSIRGRIFEIVKETKDGVKVLAPSGVKKTPLKLTFQEEKVISEAIVSQVKATEKPLVVTKVTKPTEVSGLLPLVSLRQPSISPFGDVVSDVSRIRITGRTTQDFFLQPQARELDITKQPTILDIAPSKIKVEDRIKLLDLVSQKDLQKERGRLKQQTKQVSKLKLSEIQVLRLDQVPRQAQRQQLFLRLLSRQVTRQRTPTPTTTPTPRPTTPRPKIPKVPTPFSNIFRQIAKGEIKGEIDIKVRKGGKDIKIGEARTPQEAKEILKERLLETLRASGFAERGGKKIDLGFLGEGFRKSKTDPLRVVEIKRKRIKKKEVSKEAQEIQFFRKTKSSKNLFGF